MRSECLKHCSVFKSLKKITVVCFRLVNIFMTFSLISIFNSVFYTRISMEYLHKASDGTVQGQGEETLHQKSLRKESEALVVLSGYSCSSSCCSWTSGPPQPPFHPFLWNDLPTVACLVNIPHPSLPNLPVSQNKRLSLSPYSQLYPALQHHFNSFNITSTTLLTLDPLSQTLQTDRVFGQGYASRATATNTWIH